MKFLFNRKEEAQINTVYSNIRINEDGYLVSDIQNILPPQRDICLDLYTGLVHVSLFTWKSYLYLLLLQHYVTSCFLVHVT